MSSQTRLFSEGNSTSTKKGLHQHVTWERMDLTQATHLYVEAPESV
jgi:hypothetical protein